MNEAPAPPESSSPARTAATAEIQQWLTSIERCLNELCSISSEGKLNTEQNLKISNISRNIMEGVSQLAVQYQDIKQKYIYSQDKINTFSAQTDIRFQLEEMKNSLQTAPRLAEPKPYFADTVRTRGNSSVVPTKTSCVAIYPTDKDKSSEETKKLIQDLIKPEALKLHVTDMRKTKNGGVIIRERI